MRNPALNPKCPAPPNRETQAPLPAHDELLFRSVFENVALGIAQMTLSGHFLQVNQALCEMLGYTRNEMTDSEFSLLSITIPEDLVACYCEIGTLLSNKKDRSTSERRYVRQDGCIIWVEFFIYLEKDASGAPLYFIITVHDISQRKQAENELLRHHEILEQQVKIRTAEIVEAKERAESASRAKSVFLANMSHELRTPMHAILSFGKLGKELLESGRHNPDKLSKYFDRIVESGNRLLLLINELLDLSKLEASKVQLKLASHNLAKLTREAVNELDILADKKGLVIHAAVPDHLRLECDAFRVGQVIRNLLGNAIKFSPENGVISLLAAPTTLRDTHGTATVPGIELQVCDEGIGIPESELEHIFSEFTQSSKTATLAGGTGLGLAISREIVALHSGKISARNNASRGATFIMCLPLNPRLSAQALPQAEDTESFHYEI